MKAVGKILMFILLGLVATSVAAENMGETPMAPKNEKSPAILMQEAIYQEQTAGDIDKAIELYGQVLKQAADVERLAAKATYQLGLCHLKKGDQAAAAEYFRKAASSYPNQVSVVKKAKEQLDKLSPTPQGILFERLPESVLKEIGTMYGQVCSGAGLKGLYANSNIHFVDSDFVSYSGGYAYYTNNGSKPLNKRVRLSGTTNPNQSLYDVAGRKMNFEIVPNETQKGFYHIYWTPDEPVAPGQFFMYAWADHASQTVPSAPGSTKEMEKHALTMDNFFGNNALEVFFLVIGDELAIVETQEPFTTKQVVDNYTIYAWEKEVGPKEKHIVTVYLSKKKDISPEQVKGIVEKAVLTISTCAETDPKVKESLNTLEGLPDEQVVAELITYFASETANIRRSAVYILMQGGFVDISAASPKLIELMGHEENFTRGMAALALGQNKVMDAFEPLVKMTVNDKDGFARRCSAYALGLLGSTNALPVLEQALQDKDPMVAANAQAAITMLKGQGNEQSSSNNEEPEHTQEIYNDIQPDGIIRFKMPMVIVNSGTEPISTQKFRNSDFVELNSMTDPNSKPVEFTSTHEGSHYHYSVTFNPPIMPGQTFTYISEGTIKGLVNPVNGQENTFRYFMTHSPGTGAPTLRIEEYVLPAGAELISKMSDKMVQSERDGRIVLKVEEVIPAGGNLTTSFKYKLNQ